MLLPPDAVFLALIGGLVTFGASVLIVVTKRWQGVLTFDVFTGPQKFHHTLTPRIGGLAVFAGFWAAAGTAGQPLRELLFALGMSGVFAFSAGLADDVTKRVLPMLRLFMMILSGVVFCMITAGDHELVMLTVVLTSVLVGFLLVNFPFGYVFLGDGGAYFSGFLLASLAVMLPMRNPELSPWVSLLILSYPVLETVFSSIRKTIRQGHSPSQPDRVHLHMLVYRRYAKRIGKAMGRERWSNPLTSVLMWGGIMTSVVCVVVMPYTREWSILAISLQAGLYVLIYRRVALLRLPRIMKRSL